jgi:hypothetical protein
MLACLMVIVVYKILLKNNPPESSLVYWGETIALVAFGVSWLTKGEAIYPDKK